MSAVKVPTAAEINASNREFWEAQEEPSPRVHQSPEEVAAGARIVAESWSIVSRSAASVEQTRRSKSKRPKTRPTHRSAVVEEMRKARRAGYTFKQFLKEAADGQIDGVSIKPKRGSPLYGVKCSAVLTYASDSKKKHASVSPKNVEIERTEGALLEWWNLAQA